MQFELLHGAAQNKRRVVEDRPYRLVQFIMQGTMLRFQVQKRDLHLLSSRSFVADRLQRPSRHARDHLVGRYVYGYHRPGADQRALPDGDAGKNYDARTYRGAAAHARWHHLPILVRLQTPSGSRSSGTRIVDETYVVADKALLFNMNAFANKCMGADLAPRADRRVSLDLDERSNASLIANGAAVQIDKATDDDIATDSDIVGN